MIEMQKDTQYDANDWDDDSFHHSVSILTYSPLLYRSLIRSLMHLLSHSFIQLHYPFLLSSVSSLGAQDVRLGIIFTEPASSRSLILSLSLLSLYLSLYLFLWILLVSPVSEWRS